MTDAITITGAPRSRRSISTPTSTSTARSTGALGRVAANAGGVVRESVSLVGNLLLLGLDLGVALGLAPTEAKLPSAHGNAAQRHAPPRPRAAIMHGGNVIAFPASHSAGGSRRAGQE